MAIGPLIDKTLLAATLKRYEGAAPQGLAARLVPGAVKAADHRVAAVDALSEIKRFNAKLTPALRKLKYERMAVDANAFYRGTDHLAIKRLVERLGDDLKGLKPSVIQNDMHLGNLSTLPRPGKGAMFGANDFDEAYVGPALVDLTHFATSIELVARQRKLSGGETRKLVEAFGEKYRDQLERLAKGKDVDVKVPKVVADAIAKADRHGESSALDKLEKSATGAWRIKRDDVTTSLSPAVQRDVRTAFERFRKGLPAADAAAWQGYAVTDAVTTVSGVGSVGRGRYRLLLQAPDARAPRLIELKEEAASAAAAYLPGRFPAREEADRALVAARLFDPEASVYLGKTRLPVRDALESGSFVVRDAGLTKVAVDLGEIGGEDLHDLVKYGARHLANAHARGEAAGFASAKEILASLQGQLPVDLAAYARGEADQVERDHGAFVKALASGAML